MKTALETLVQAEKDFLNSVETLKKGCLTDRFDKDMKAVKAARKRLDKARQDFVDQLG